EFSFGQALMVSVGCIVCKSCHIPNCPTGITGTQGEYKGAPEHTKAYLNSVAQEVRQILASLGARKLEEIVGRSDRVVRKPSLLRRAGLIDLSKFLHPEMALAGLSDRFPQHAEFAGACERGEKTPLNRRILEAAEDAIETGQNADLMFRIKNSDRSAGATVAG